MGIHSDRRTNGWMVGLQGCHTSKLCWMKLIRCLCDKKWKIWYTLLFYSANFLIENSIKRDNLSLKMDCHKIFNMY